MAVRTDLPDIYAAFTRGSPGFVQAVQIYGGFDLSDQEIERIAERCETAAEFQHACQNESWWIARNSHEGGNPDARNKDQPIEQAAESVKDEAEEATRAGAEVTRPSGETSRSHLEAGLNHTAETLHYVSDQFAQVLGSAGMQADELARKSFQNIQAVTQAGAVLSEASQELSREWFEIMQDRLLKNIDDMNQLVGCRSLQDLLMVQSEVTRDRLGDAVISSRRFAEVSLRVAVETAKIIQAEAGRNVTGFEVPRGRTP